MPVEKQAVMKLFWLQRKTTQNIQTEMIETQENNSLCYSSVKTYKSRLKTEHLTSTKNLLSASRSNIFASDISENTSIEMLCKHQMDFAFD